VQFPLVTFNRFHVAAKIEEARRVIRFAGFERVAEVGDDFRRNGFGPENAHRLGKVAADHRPHILERSGLRGGVHMRDAELRIYDVDAERSALDQFGKSPLAPADLLLSPFVFGDVAGYHHRADNGAVIAANGSKAIPSHPGFARVLPLQGIFGVGGRFAAESPRHGPHIRRSLSPIGQERVQDLGAVGDALAALLLVPEPVIGCEGIVSVDEPTLGVGNEHGVGHAGQRRFQSRRALVGSRPGG